MVRKDKLDKARIQHLQREPEGSGLAALKSVLRSCGPSGTSLTFHTAYHTAWSLFILYLFEQSYVLTIFIDLFN